MQGYNKLIIGWVMLAGSAYAHDNPFTPNLTADSVNMSTSVGIIRGEANEYVYNPELGTKLSQLIWKIDQLPIIKGDLSWDAYTFLTLNAKGWASVTSGSGYMDDYDWTVDGQSAPSHHSWHPKTIVNSGSEFDLNAKIWLLSFDGGKLGGPSWLPANTI